MLWSIIAGMAFACLATNGRCEPLILEQASNVAGKGQIEVGLNGAYGTDEFTLAGSQGTDFTYTAQRYDFFLRHGFTNRLEWKAIAPFVAWTMRQESSSMKTSQTKSGFGDMGFQIKANLWTINNAVDTAVLMNVILPTGDANKGLGEGLNLTPGVVLSRKSGVLPLDMNLAYSVTREYTVSGTKVNTGDVVLYGISGGYKKGAWTFLTELIGETFGQEKQNGINVSKTAGSRLDLVPGIRYHRGTLKLKSGVKVALGQESMRQYDWQAFLGVSVSGRLSFRMN